MKRKPFYNYFLMFLLELDIVLLAPSITFFVFQALQCCVDVNFIIASTILLLNIFIVIYTQKLIKNNYDLLL
jgi:hypothetical protein